MNRPGIGQQSNTNPTRWRLVGDRYWCPSEIRTDKCRELSTPQVYALERARKEGRSGIAGDPTIF